MNRSPHCIWRIIAMVGVLILSGPPSPFLSPSAVVAKPFVPLSSPQLTLILPRGVQRGGTYQLKFQGARLFDPKEVLFYGSGIQVTGIKPINPQQIEVTIKVAPDCRLGEHVCQVRTGAGITEFRSIYVGALPEVAEKEPNNGLDEAQPIKSGVTVSGVITNEDIDYFRITARKGERISVEVEGIRLGFLFDPAIALLDADRFEIVTCDDTPLTKQDPFFSVLAPKDGDYFIAIRESAFRGNSQSRYRMHVGPFPRPHAVFPAGGKPGEKTQLTFLDSTGPDGTLHSVSQEITLPTLDHFHGGLFFSDDRGISPSPLPFRLSSLDNTIEKEPNNTWPATPALSLPIAINGIIGQPDDMDYYKFHAKKGQVWHIACYARRLGSGLDPVINVFGPDKKNIVGNDDTTRLDSEIRFQAPADADYYLRVRDHLKRGRPDFVYRVEIEGPTPQLTLGIKRVDRFSQKRQTIAVPRANRFAVLVTAQRKNFGGAIELLGDNLPEGMTMTAPPMHPDLNLMPVVFEASEKAPIGGKLIDFRGRHTDPAKGITGHFENSADFVLGLPNNALYYSCTVDKLAVAVIDPVPFKLELVPPQVPLLQNGSIRIKVRVQRDKGFDQPIRIQFPFRSPGVGTTYQLTIPKGKSEIEYPLNANGNARVGKWPMVVIGTANVKGPAWVATQMAELEVAPPFVKIDFERAVCEVGKTTQLHGKIQQMVPFEGEATATILGLPPGITVTSPVTFTKATQEITFEIATTDKARPKKHTSLFCQVTIKRKGEPMVTRTGSIVLQINKPKPPPKPPAPDPGLTQTSPDKKPTKATSHSSNKKQ